MIGKPFDLLDGLQWILGRNVDRGAQPGVSAQPMVGGPTVEGTTIGGTVISIGMDSGGIGATGEDSQRNVIFIKVAFDGNPWLHRGVDIFSIPQVMTGAGTGHVGVANTGHHRAKVFDILDIMARQIGKKGFLIGQVMMDIGVNDERLNGRVSAIGQLRNRRGQCEIGHEFLLARRGSRQRKSPLP